MLGPWGLQGAATNWLHTSRAPATDRLGLTSTAEVLQLLLPVSSGRRSWLPSGWSAGYEHNGVGKQSVCLRTKAVRQSSPASSEAGPQQGHGPQTIAQRSRPRNGRAPQQKQKQSPLSADLQSNAKRLLEEDESHLTVHINNAPSLASLADLVKTHGPHMNIIHLTAAMVKLSRLSAAGPPAGGPAGKRGHPRWAGAQQPGSTWTGEGWASQQSPGSTIEDQDGEEGENQDGRAALPEASSGRPRSQRLAAAAAHQRAVKDTAVQLLSLLRPRVLELDGRGVATVLTALSKLRLRDPLSEDLLYLSQQYLQEFDAQGFSTTVHAAASLGIRPQREWMSAFFRHSKPLLPRFGPQALSNTLWALARLRLAPGSASSSKDWELAMYTAARHALQSPSCQPQSASLIAWSLGELDLFPPQDLRAALAEAGLRHLQGSTPQGVANLVWGMARLKCPLSKQWMRRFAQVTLPQLPTYSPVILSTLLYAFATMGRLPPGFQAATTVPGATSTSNDSNSGTSNAAAAANKPSTNAAASQGGSTSQQQPDDDEGSVESQWGSVLQGELLRALPLAGPQVTVNVLYSFAKLGRVPEAELLQALLSRACDQLGDMTSQGLSNTVWALARLHVAPGPRWLGSFMEESFAKMGLMSPQELSNTLWALAQLRARPDSMWIARMDRESEDRLHDYTPQNLSNTLHAFASFRYCPSPDWQQAFGRQLRVVFTRIAPIQAADLLWACAELGLGHILPPGTLPRMAAVVTGPEALTSLTAQQLASALYAMVKLGAAPSASVMGEVAAEVGGNMDRVGLGHLAEVAWAMASAGYTPPGEWVSRLDAQVMRHLQGHQVTPLTQQSGALSPHPGGSRSGPSGLQRPSPLDSSHAQGATASQASTRHDLLQPPSLPHPALQQPAGRVQVSSHTSPPPAADRDKAEALCRWAAARPALGSPPSTQLVSGLASLLTRPSVLHQVPAAHVLLAVSGLAAMGPHTQAELLQWMTASAGGFKQATGSVRAAPTGGNAEAGNSIVSNPAGPHSMLAGAAGAEGLLARPVQPKHRLERPLGHMLAAG